MVTVRNRNALLRSSDVIDRKRRAVLIDIANHVFNHAHPDILLKKSFNSKEVKKYKRIYIIGIGKAARSMVAAALKCMPKKPTKIFYADSGHPLPSERGILNTKKILSLRGLLTSQDLVIVMISGGGSAMMVSPPPGVSLQDKVDLTRNLLRCGAKIDEVNVVRKHLSRVKGGKLAQVLFPAQVRAYIISDVIGNDLSVIASGPLSADSSSFNDAIKILKKYKIHAPSSIKKYLAKGAKDPRLETIKKGDPILKNVQIKIIGDHFSAATIAASYAQKKGFNVIQINTCLMGEAKDVAPKLIRDYKKQLTKPHTLIVGCGETTVTCHGTGVGGRNQEFALSALNHLPQNVSLLSIGTDGVDGMCPTKVAGAIVDVSIAKTASQNKINAEKYLSNNDSYTFFKKVRGHVITGPTGNNLGDLVLLITD